MSYYPTEAKLESVMKEGVAELCWAELPVLESGFVSLLTATVFASSPSEQKRFVDDALKGSPLKRALGEFGHL